MGYYMEQRATRFEIKKENVDAALQAVKRLAGKETILDAGGHHFSWVNSKFIEAKTLEEAMKYWRWEIDFYDGSDVKHVTFLGEKLGDDALLFEAIAPFVQEESFIEMWGEDGHAWRWEFRDKKLTERTGTVTVLWE